MESPKRLVHCEDAISWLNQQKILNDSSFVASMPDISEFPQFKLHEWQNWFLNTAALIMSKCPDDGVTIFFQSDIKHEGEWVDKGYLCQKAAEAFGQKLLWHKIICRAPVGIATFGKPAYSHLLCFSKSLKIDVAKSSADVVPEMGEKVWQRGMGIEPALIAARFILEQTTCRTVINPFCGQGSMLAAANALGLHAVGIEKSPGRAEKARQLQLAKDGKKWQFSQDES